MSARPIQFITGTDTGVGKTVLTAFLLHHGRTSGRHTLALKPFCSGGRADVQLLQALQPEELSDCAVNPFYFAQPVAPLAALAPRQKPVTLEETVKHVLDIRAQCEELIVEGSGGLLVPLGKNFLVADLIAALPVRVIVVAQNRLGAINHTLLTVEALRARAILPETITVVLMGRARPDLAARGNAKLLKQLLPARVIEFPFLGKPNSAAAVRRHYPAVKKILARL